MRILNLTMLALISMLHLSNGERTRKKYNRIKDLARTSTLVSAKQREII